MLPPIEFSTGRMPCDVRPDPTASKTSSNRSSATVSAPGQPRCAAVSLYAPGRALKCNLRIASYSLK